MREIQSIIRPTTSPGEKLVKRARLKSRSREAAVSELPSLDEALAVFSMEVARARRYERPLSAMTAPRSIILEDRVPLRVTDVAAHLGSGRFIALLIETGPSEAQALAERIRRQDPECDVRVASFPEDALTLDELMSEVI